MRFEDEPIVKLVSSVGYQEASRLTKLSEPDIKQAIALAKGKHDKNFFTSNLLKIRTKEGRISQLTYNKGQKKIQEAIERQRAAGKPVRIKLLKARQFGGSTKVQADFFESVVYDKNKQYLTVCHDLDSARNMRAMFERFYDNFILTKPQFKRVSDKWWKFPQKDSDYLIDTAEELDTGRSFTIHRLHVSEIAYYRDPETLMTGLLQSVPDHPDTMIVVESTANGIGDYFYNFIHLDNGYELVFVAWYEIEDYVRVFESDQEKERLQASLTAYEKSLLDRVTLEQLNWRRYRIKDKLNGDEEKFKQEFPATAEEAFIASGRPYFPISFVHKELLRSEKVTPKRGYLEWTKVNEEVEFVEDRNGWWKVSGHPEDGYVGRYVIGADSAEGKATDEAGKDPDYSAGVVFDRLSGKEVARFTARIDTDLFGVELRKANCYFKAACVCIERNASGLAVIGAVKDVEGMNLYRRELLGKVEDKETVEYGFQTNAASRDLLLSELRTWVRTEAYRSDDYEFWKECSTFVYDSKGKPQGQRGTHDDRVLSAALAVQAVGQANELYPIEKPGLEKHKAQDDDSIWTPEEEEIGIAEF